MSKNHSLRCDYYNKFGSVELWNEITDDNFLKYHIDTENYSASTICSNGLVMEQFEEDIITLFQTTFNNPKLTSTLYINGEVLSEAQFEHKIKVSSYRSKYSNPFTEMMIKDKEDNVIGEEVINYGFDDYGNYIPSTGRLSYIIAENYHGKHVASECVGAFVLFHAAKLYEDATFINQNFNGTQYVNGSLFSRLETSVFQSNIPSQVILFNNGFNKYSTCYSLYHRTYSKYNKNFLHDELNISGAQDNTSQILNIDETNNLAQSLFGVVETDNISE